MKHCQVMTAIFLLAFAGLSAQEKLRVLPMEADATDATVLLVSLPHLEPLASELTAGLLDADVRLLGKEERVLATLGVLKKGKLKWGHKKASGQFLAVRFAAEDAAALQEALRSGNPRAGVRLAVQDRASGQVLNQAAVALSEFADVAVQLNYPVNARPGEELGAKVTVAVENLGSRPVQDLRLQLVLSGDDKIPLRAAAPSPGFAEDMLLAGGLQTVAALAPGEKVSVSFPGPLPIPADTPPGKHYLAVVADPEERVAELSESNNIGKGFILINVPAPAAFTVELPETLLHFKPDGYRFEIRCGDILLSDGKDWKLCRMKPNIYQLQHVSWKNVFWEVNTHYREVYEISGAPFCKKGGSDRSIDIRVEVSGGSLSVPPESFTLKLVKTSLRFEPESKNFLLQAHGRPIFHLPFWWSCRRESYLYQFRYAPWQELFLQVNTLAKEAFRVSGGKFCSDEGQASKLPWAVKVEP